MSEKLDSDGMKPQEMQQESREVTPESKVGLSLSFCVEDILNNIVKEEEIKEIIASTNASTPEQIDKLINSYKKTYWQVNPEEGEAIARRLFVAGKVKQPRTEGGEAHTLDTGHWLDAEQG